jgi:hypothetical protein
MTWAVVLPEMMRLLNQGISKVSGRHEISDDADYRLCRDFRAVHTVMAAVPFQPATGR